MTDLRKVPVCGYDSKSEAVLALRAKGLTYRQVGRRTQLDKSSVAVILNRARRRGHLVSLPLSFAAAPALIEAARLRGISLSALCLALLETAGRDDMVDAILDDRGEQ